ncbi:MAG: DNA internalization-related competence protein ComEC/Rec2 [Gammaproteobacteria bacterium]|nr:DNA internalization-related competence protein ComEC/Rec2 [Gammaproteobacteria bacterium]MBI5618855.1 DNA internalization-related competence protein ComEC/Rec2 [Gammaproteobacteria bacterium]
MRATLCCLCAGLLLCQLLPALPPLPLLLLLPATCWALRARLPRGAIVLVLGFTWAVARAGLDLAARLEPAFEGATLIASGRLAGAPRAAARGLRLQVDLDALAQGARAVTGPRTVELAWYEPRGSLPEPGAVCRFAVRLRRPHGTANPGGFDSEGWQFARGIDAVGYVVPHPRNGCDPQPGAAVVERARARVAAAIRAAAPGPAGDVIVALAVGDESGIDVPAWRVLRNTGTAHLVSVSGLHIALVAGLAFVATRWLWSRSVGLLRLAAAARVAPWVAILAAAAYTLLAGAQVPAVRSLLMVSAGLLCGQFGQRVLGTDALLAALAVILVIDPAASLSVSLWLSFGAVGLLILMSATRQPAGRMRREIAQHVGFTLWLAPLIGIVFQSIAVSAPAANLLAVPWTTFVVTPLALLGVALAPLQADAAAMMWRIAAWSWELAWQYLVWLDRAVPVLALPAAPGAATALLAGLAVFVWWIPLLPARRWLAPLLLCALAAGAGARPAPGELQLTVLDVGQGLATVLRTAHHTLVYDAGPRYPGGNAGERVVLPFLRARGVRTIDALVLSHPDSDHVGGAPALIEALPVRRILVSPRETRLPAAQRCAAGERWIWDGVQFTVLHPAAPAATDNDGSCVLRVTTAGGSILLPGDGETATEEALQALPSLRSAIIVVPHHGSATSSHPGFVAAVRPRYALVAAGHRNRFGFPAPGVVANYRAVGAAILETSALGALDLELTARGTRVRAHRLEHRHYWQDAPRPEALSGLH